MSKSLGNIISPLDLIQKYGSESVRYFLFRNIPFGDDGDFSEAALIERHNNELANKLGNLVSRLSALAEQHGLQKATLPDSLNSKKILANAKQHFESFALDRALAELFSFIDAINEFIQKEKPWETHDRKVLYQAANAIKDAAILLSPFLPETAEKISKVFNFELSLKSLKSPLPISKIKKSSILFKKIDMAFPPFKQPAPSHETPPSSLSPQSKPSSDTNASKVISYDDFAKLDLRVGKILKVEDHPHADKLYVLTVDLGEAKPRTVVAGLHLKYGKEQLLNKKAIFVTNLAPRMLKGIESRGMILAAGDTHETVVLLVPEKDIEEGSKVK